MSHRKPATRRKDERFGMQFADDAGGDAGQGGNGSAGEHDETLAAPQNETVDGDEGDESAKEARGQAETNLKRKRGTLDERLTGARGGRQAGGTAAEDDRANGSEVSEDESDKAIGADDTTMACEAASHTSGLPTRDSQTEDDEEGRRQKRLRGGAAWFAATAPKDGVLDKCSAMNDSAEVAEQRAEPLDAPPTVVGDSQGTEGETAECADEGDEGLKGCDGLDGGKEAGKRAWGHERKMQIDGGAWDEHETEELLAPAGASGVSGSDARPDVDDATANMGVMPLHDPDRPLPAWAEDADSNEITEEEKLAVPEFFCGRPIKTPQRYLGIRRHLQKLWDQQKPRYLKKSSCLGIKGDVNAIGRVHAYLETIGVINVGHAVAAISTHIASGDVGAGGKGGKLGVLRKVRAEGKGRAPGTNESPDKDKEACLPEQQVDQEAAHHERSPSCAATSASKDRSNDQGEMITERSNASAAARAALAACALPSRDKDKEREVEEEAYRNRFAHCMPVSAPLPPKT